MGAIALLFRRKRRLIIIVFLVIYIFCVMRFYYSKRGNSNPNLSARDLAPGMDWVQLNELGIARAPRYTTQYDADDDNLDNAKILDVNHIEIDSNQENEFQDPVVTKNDGSEKIILNVARNDEPSKIILDVAGNDAPGKIVPDVARNDAPEKFIPDVARKDGSARAELLHFRRKRFEGYMFTEMNRTGPGEHGEAVVIADKDTALAHEEMDTKGFHLFVSDQIALDRALKDVRSEMCQYATVPEDLPTLSVIIIFCNEALSTLLRTVHGVVNRTPPDLLHEVILVDDASDNEELKHSLDDIVRITWPDGIVNIIRLSNRSGLIRTRLAGARAATGDVIAVFDAHVEVTKGWAEPILATIQKDPKTLVAPTLDYIDTKTFKYIPGNPFSTVKFRWDMGYEWLPLLESQKQDPRVPIQSDVLIGCAFAMQREAFFAMGSFDEGMNVWGAENIEIGLRVSMCGGSVVNLPCSRVAHLFRNRKPWTVDSWDTYDRNFRRVAEVWMEDYIKYFYKMKPKIKSLDPGDITDRMAWKRELGCHDFKWFLDNVSHKFIYDVNVTAWGKLSTKASGRNICLDMRGWELPGLTLGISTCRDTDDQAPAEQLFSLTWDDRLRAEYTCATYKGTESGGDVRLEMCDGSEAQLWDYNEEGLEFVHRRSGLCLDAAAHIDSKYTSLKECNKTLSQRWTWEHYEGPPGV